MIKFNTRFAVLLIFILSTQIINAQIYGKAKRNYFPNTNEYETSGWYFDPGITTHVVRPDIQEKLIDSLNYEFDSKAKIGLAFGVGRYKILKNWMFFKYWEYGASYKLFRGAEDHAVDGLAGQSGSFSDHSAGLNTRLTNVIGIAEYSFIQNSFGLNVDYQFKQKRTPGSGVEEVYPDRLVAQLHYKFGFGFWIAKKLLVIPSVQFPIVGALPKVLDPTFTYFNSWYEPLIISIRIMPVRNKVDKCPPVYAPGLPDGFTPDGMD